VAAAAAEAIAARVTGVVVDVAGRIAAAARSGMGVVMAVGRGRGRQRAEASDREESTENEAPKTESKGTVQGEIGELGQFLVGVVERMKLGSFEISEAQEDDFLVYQLRGEAATALARGDGKGADAIQLLVNQAAKNASEDPQRIVVDIEGRTDDREETLGKLASRAASRALDSGRTIALEAMNPSDRRIVHVTLRDEERVATMSIGSGRYRQVVVVPEGAPEWEEAQEASKSANG